jgi:hypothetical protein
MEEIVENSNKSSHDICSANFSGDFVAYEVSSEEAGSPLPNSSRLCSNEATLNVSSEEATHNVCPLPNSSGLCSNEATFRVSSEEATHNVCPLPKPTILKNSKKIRSNSFGDLNLYSGLGCLRTPEAFKVDALRASDPRASYHERDIHLSGLMPRIEVKDADADTDTETELASLSIPTPNTLKYLFRSHIPIDYLYDVLEKICVKNEKYYIIDFNSYRLLQFHELYTDFSERIIQAYKPSKQKYVTRTLTYNSFVTIVRHICRINGIPFDTKFNYQYSLYNIDYYIYFTYHPTPSLFPPMLSR